MTPLLRAAAVAVAILFAPSAVAADKRPMQVEDLFKLKRVAAPQISPDGKLVAYQVTTPDLAANKTTTAVWVAAADGSAPPRQVTSSGKRDAAPRWHPNSKKLH